MLYDNAALLAAYGDGYAATGESLFARIADETADWVIRDMQDPDGGFYATLDADSEGHEGRFYLWTPAQLDELLTAEENTVAREHYGLNHDANFENEAWHLHAAVPIDDLDAGMPPSRAKRAFSKPGMVRRTRVCSPWVILVWKPTML